MLFSHASGPRFPVAISVRYTHSVHTDHSRDTFASVFQTTRLNTDSAWALILTRAVTVRVYLEFSTLFRAVLVADTLASRWMTLEGELALATVRAFHKYLLTGLLLLPTSGLAVISLSAGFVNFMLSWTTGTCRKMIREISKYLDC